MTAPVASNDVAFVAADTEEARDSLARLQRLYGAVDPEQAAVVVALGGDGFMLETLHRFSDRQTPIYGMNRGTVGFLMNMYQEDGLPERLASASKVTLHKSCGSSTIGPAVPPATSPLVRPAVASASSRR